MMPNPKTNSTSPIDIFDRAAIRVFRNRAAAKISDYNFLFDLAFKNLAERLQVIRRKFPQALLLGARQSPDLALSLGKQSGIEALSVFELSHKMLTRYQALDKEAAAAFSITAAQADEEFLPCAADSLDLIISNLGLHSVNDLPGTLIQINRTLKPDGLFLGAMLGGETLYELREILNEVEIRRRGGVSPHISPFADKQQMGGLLQRAGFALPVVDSDIITVSYENIFKLMADLRGMGESNAVLARNKTPISHALLIDAAQLYQERYGEADGRIKASFEIIYLLGWAPHDSQQKPLRPGSAKHNLADALQTDEIKL